MNDNSATPETAAAFRPWPRRCAMLLSVVTFVLITVGALVTTYDAGMAVPDWPTTYGYNMFAYPWQTWLTGPFDLLIEHGHRLLGSLVGMIAIGFVLAVFCSSERPWMKIVSIVALLAVIGQGILGGARVLFDDGQLAMIHGCVGPAFFALTAAIVSFTSPFWFACGTSSTTTSQLIKHDGAYRLEPIAWTSIAIAVLAYIQLVLGAAIRHVPIDATANYFRVSVLFHVGVAVALLIYAFSAAQVIYRKRETGLRGPVSFLVALIGTQFGLGVATYIMKYGWPSWFADETWAAGFVIQTKSLAQSLTVTGHVANGSLILAAAVTLAVRAVRISATKSEHSSIEGSNRVQSRHALSHS